MEKGGGGRRDNNDDDCGWWKRRRRRRGRRKVQGEETSEEPGNARVGEKKGGEAFFLPFGAKTMANSGRALGLIILFFFVFLTLFLSVSLILNKVQRCQVVDRSVVGDSFFAR